MTLLTFHEILDAAKRLPYEEQAVLIAQLQKRSKPPSARRNNAMREQVLAEFERRKRMGAFHQVERLHGAFAHPALNLSFEEIQTITGEMEAAWKTKLDEL